MPYQIILLPLHSKTNKMELIQALINCGEAENVADAKEIIKEMRERIYEGENPEEILFEIGLEPDYVFDLIG